MTFSRIAPGPQLGAGRLRVDAARAIAKLREYQLADRTTWILEAIRAAVASSATRIELRGDANDIWLAWDGAAWPVEDLPRLFDELVSPEPTGDRSGRGRHHLRLLAAGVNSALGMNPAYVDVIAIGDTATHRARYTPEVLDDSGDLGESAMRKIAAEPIERPLGARPGMLVHLRRRVSLEVLSYLLHAPPELAVARAACRDLAVPLVIGDEIFDRAHSTDVLRVPLGEQLDGFIAAIDPARASEHEATIEIAERGVVLVRYAIDLFGTGLRRAPVPIRVFVDAPRMPTNASRSQVRHEDYPIHAAEQRAVQVVHELIARLGADITNPRARDAVIALLTSEVAIGTAEWQSAVHEISKPLHQLGELPLVRDAVGKPRPLASSWNGLVHEGAKPFDDELAPWLSDVIWIPHGDPAARLVEYGLLDTRALRRRVRWARRQRNAHRRFYDHRPGPATLAPRTKPRIRAPLGIAVDGTCVPDQLFAGLTGEVCVDIDPGRGGELIVLLEGREIERQKFDGPLAFVVVIDSKQVTPGDRYRGVVRDAQYKHVERAMRAGIVRAIEALFVAKAPGVEFGPESPVTDLQLARAALPLVGELGLAMRGPLTIAPVWLAGKTRVSLAELLRAGLVGVVELGALDPARTPAGRTVVEASSAEHTMLRRLLHGRVLGYDRARPPNARLLANQLLKLGANALVIRDGDTVGAIAPAKESSLTLYHMGNKLESRAYTPNLFSCAIALDSPALVPSAAWSSLADDAGVASQSYLAWEVNLVRATASALAGDRPEELVGPGACNLESELGRLLCTAVLRAEPPKLLGEALLAQLRRARIISVYGAMVLRSLDELVALPGEELAYVTEDGVAIPGFVAMVATELAARALAKLVGRRARDATAELEDRRREALFASRLASHRTQLPRPVALPPGVGITVPLESTVMRGVVGVGTGALAVEVFVEGRPFTRVQPRPSLPGIAPVPELPLVAAIEVAPEQCGPTFDGLPYEVIAAMAVALRGAATTLVIAIANQTPELLATTGPARTLLARLLVQPEPPNAETLLALRGAPILATVQGARISVEQALRGSHFISTATWQEPWLTDEANVDVLDAPIVFMPDGESETHAILVGLHGGLVADVTEGVRKLQSQRRMARGLLPTPKVRGVPRELVRELHTLGPIGKKLGHGEIGLVSPVGGTLGESTLLIHDHGVMRGRVVLDVMPPIQLAIEAPELVTRDPFDLNARLSALGLSEAEPHKMTDDAQALASALVIAVTRELPLLPAPLRRGVLRAWIAGRVPDLDGVPLFETDGPILDHTAIASQIIKFGNVWAVPALRSERPLDDERIVFRMTAEDISLARTRHRPIIDATHELALDAIARQNRARAAVTELAISHDGVLATATLDGDGVTAPRGVVGVLVPGIAAQIRGLRTHRQMRPFDVTTDPCKWPTIAAIDDARLEPDRTWANPERRGAWLDVIARVREASEAALARIVEPPHDALVIDAIDGRAIDGLATLRAARGTQLRGLVWLTDAPYMATSTVDLVNTDRQSVARWDGLAGRLFAFTPEAVDLGAVLTELLDASHARLLRALLERQTEIDPNVLEVHVALGLAARHVLPRDAKGITFDCFAPRALQASELAAMFGGTDPVPAVTLADDAEPRVVTFVDDDTALARVVRAQLGLRIRRVEPSPFVPPRTTPIVMPGSKPDDGHVLANLVRVLDHRLQDLGITGFHWLIVDRQTALVRFDGTIHLGGSNHRLLAIASAHAANSPWAPAAIDAVTAHVVTVLNVALTEITDTTEAHALGTLLAGTVSWSA